MDVNILSSVEEKLGNLPQVLFDAIKKPFMIIYDKLIEIYNTYKPYMIGFLIIIAFLFIMKIIMSFTSVYHYVQITQNKIKLNKKSHPISLDYITITFAIFTIFTIFTINII